MGVKAGLQAHGAPPSNKETRNRQLMQALAAHDLSVRHASLGLQEARPDLHREGVFTSGSGHSGRAGLCAEQWGRQGKAKTPSHKYMP